MSLPKSGHACALGVVFFSLFVFCYPGGTGPLLSETENFELSRLEAFKSRRILQVDAAGLDYDYPTAEFVSSPPASPLGDNETDVNKTDKRIRVLDQPPKVQAPNKLNQQLHHSSIMPESPEEHLKLLSLKQGEM